MVIGCAAGPSAEWQLELAEVVVIPEALETEGVELRVIQRRVKLELLMLIGPVININSFYTIGCRIKL